MKTEKIKVFLSDPQILFREGIHFTLSGEEDFEVTGETTSNEEAFESIEANIPNVAIMNMKGAKLSGAEATCRIKRNFPSVAVILVADGTDEKMLFDAIKCGASACVTKDADPEWLVSLIREVYAGEQPIVEALLTPGMAAKALEAFQSLSPLTEQLSNLLARLSPRESEVLSSVAAGNDLSQVAAKLSSSEEAIRHQLRLIVNKLVANDQTLAVIETAQQAPAFLPGRMPGKAADYVTREEFTEFKESLMQRLKLFIGELA